MKKSLIKFYLFIVIILLSCDKDYLEEPKPTGTINSDAVFKSKTSFNNYETIGDSKHGLAYLPQTAKDAIGYFR